ncbi:hypothetical protein A0J61_00831 [Choanephora cucurbitarum]|uniref:Uncharacterized protein n=1 Tax=Choanephora cucurbitarum TaxID=101091 RepID=A0A1C7NPS1_9FUNG|nr:hypothetical protein A0J61_00831 [Choanephora cucurbitarum]
MALNYKIRLASVLILLYFQLIYAVPVIVARGKDKQEENEEAVYIIYPPSSPNFPQIYPPYPPPPIYPPNPPYPPYPPESTTGSPVIAPSPPYPPELTVPGLAANSSVIPTSTII